MKTKYRYYYNPLNGFFLRVDQQGYAYYYLEDSKRWDNKWSYQRFALTDFFVNYQEVTLSQGLHYIKGNYVE